MVVSELMRPTFFLIVISLLLMVSCSSLNSTKRIKIFEQALGNDNSKALSNFVDAFENEILKKKYPSLELDKAYAKLLSEEPYSMGSMKLYDLLTDNSLEHFFRSQLWNEIYAPIDSIWIENSELRSRYVYIGEDGKKLVGETGHRFKKNTNIDSLLRAESGICRFNNQGKYWQALNSVKNGIPFLEEFCSVKNNVGEITTSLFSDMVNRHNLDFNDYLARRIIVVELSKFINDARDPEKYMFANKPIN